MKFDAALRLLGVTSVGECQQMDAADIEGLGMAKFEKERLKEALHTQMRASIRLPSKLELSDEES